MKSRLEIRLAKIEIGRMAGYTIVFAGENVPPDAAGTVIIVPRRRAALPPPPLGNTCSGTLQ